MQKIPGMHVQEAMMVMVVVMSVFAVRHINYKVTLSLMEKQRKTQDFN